MVEIGERDDQPDVVLLDERAQRGEVAGVVDARHDLAVIGDVERRRELAGVDRERRRAGAAKRGDDVDPLPRAGEEDHGHVRRTVAVEAPRL